MAFRSILLLLLLLHTNQAARAAGLFVIDQFHNNTHRVNAETGETVRVGALGRTGVTGLAYNPADGQLYGIDRDLDQLVIISQTNGRATTIGGLGLDIVAGDIAFTPGGLYMNDYSRGRLYSVNPATGAAALVGRSVSAQGLAYDPVTDMLYAARGEGGDPTSGLYSLNRTTGAATFVGGFGVNIYNNGITKDPFSSRLYLTDNSTYSLLTVDPSTGAASLVARLGGGVVDVTGIAFVIPEPSAAFLGAVSVTGLLFRRRRRAAII